MQPRIHPRHLSEAQIRTLLQKKLNAARQTRLERYHRTGRRILLVPDDGEPSISAFHSQPILKTPSPNPRLAWLPSFSERLLLFFETAAMLGVVLVAGMGWNYLRHTNHAAQKAFALPALTPTPLIRAVVIPSGHTLPNAAGRTYRNMAEIPPHLRPLVQTYASLPAELPTPAPEQAIRINIPAIDVDAPVVQGDSWEQLKKGVAQHLGTAGPGQTGNLVL